MSRLNPWANTTAGAAGSPAARTCSSVPSDETTGPRSSGGSWASCSPRSGSTRRRSRRIIARPATTPAAVPTVRPAAHAAAFFHLRRSGSAIRSTVDARDAGAHPAGDLVLDGAQQLGELSGRDLLVPLVAQQHDLVAGSHLVVAAVHQELVHGDGPGHPVAAAADQHVGARGETPPVPVRVSDRDRGDGCVALQPVGQAVGEGLPRGEPPDQRHGGTPPHRRTEPLPQPGTGRQAAQRHPHPHQVEMRLGVPDDRAAVRRVPPPGPDAVPLERPAHVEEPAELSEGRLGIVLGAREVGPQPVDAQARVHRPPDEGRDRFGREQTDPVHPGVGLHVDDGSDPGLVAGPHESPETLLCIDGQRDVRPERVGLGPRRDLGQHQDRRGESRSAELEGLFQERHAEPGRAGLQRGAGSLQRAVAVPVRLHHGHELGALRLHEPHVVAYGVEVDLRDRRTERALGGGRGPAAGRQPASRSARTAAGTWSRTSSEVAPSPSRAPARSPARPCTYAPAQAASAGTSPRARNAAMTPVSTSPVPAVARTGPPVAFTCTRPPGSATRVGFPFNRTVVPLSEASERTLATRSAPTSAPASRANSPAWGVRTRSAASSFASSSTRRANAVSPSASTTAGTGVASTSARTNASVSSVLPSPGPTATASTTWSRSRSASTAASETVPSGVWGSATNVASVRPACTTGTIPSGTATCTRPAHARYAAPAISRTAPVMVREPPTTRTMPDERLWLSGSRLGSIAATSARSTSNRSLATRSGGNPMSATSTIPACPAPGCSRWPGFSDPNVTVTVASTATPATAPVVPSTPEAMSTATTGDGAPAKASMASPTRPSGTPRNPVPTMPSTTTAPRSSSRISPSAPRIATPALRARRRFAAAASR